MNIRFLATNGIVAAVYIAVTLLIAPFAFGEIQLRLPEMLNHLVVFNPKYAIGVILGVFIANTFSPIAAYDLIFGVGQSILALALIIFIGKYVKNIVARLAINTFIFTFTMFIIAYELQLVYELPFLWTWLTVAIGELIVMAIGAPIMYTINKRLDFNKFMS